jgi:hypothetical protein
MANHPMSGSRGKRAQLRFAFSSVAQHAKRGAKRSYDGQANGRFRDLQLEIDGKASVGLAPGAASVARQRSVQWVAWQRACQAAEGTTYGFDCGCRDDSPFWLVRNCWLSLIVVVVWCFVVGVVDWVVGCRCVEVLRRKSSGSDRVVTGTSARGTGRGPSAPESGPSRIGGGQLFVGAGPSFVGSEP